MRRQSFETLEYDAARMQNYIVNSLYFKQARNLNCVRVDLERY
jgi:hypothetical protein